MVALAAKLKTSVFDELDYRPLGCVCIFHRLKSMLVFDYYRDRVLNTLDGANFAFRPSMGTTDLLVTLHAHILHRLGQPTAVIISDITKAYDHVLHDAVESVCEEYGIREAWILHVLNSVTYRLLVARGLSESIKPRRGTIQGDLLSILIFACLADRWCAVVRRLPRELAPWAAQFVDDGVGVVTSPAGMEALTNLMDSHWRRDGLSVGKRVIVANAQYNLLYGTNHPYTAKVLGTCLHLESDGRCAFSEKLLASCRASNALAAFDFLSCRRWTSSRDMCFLVFSTFRVRV
jgi:hypothetical protein